MAIDTSTTTSSTTTSASAAAASQLGVDYNSFLTLLTAQIQNQDPLEPMDSTEFVSQLAQLSQVEQAVTTNAHLENLTSYLSSAVTLSGLGLIGRDVTVATDRVELIEGAASFDYELEANASSAIAVITDASGNVIRQISGLSTSGETRYTVEWDGLDDSGAQVSDGTYYMAIQAVDADGNGLDYNSYATTQVNSVDLTSDSQVLKLRNGEEVEAADLVSVS